MGLFREPAYLLWAVLALAAAAALAGWSHRRRERLLERFARPEVLPRLFDTGALEVRRRRYWLRTAALIGLLIALAGPQWGIRLVTTRSEGSQIMIAVDTSLSMLAEDLKPNRMERAKNALSQLIDGLKGNRIGLIAFAGEAQVQCPLTTDTGAVKSFLRRMETGMIPQPGTAIGKAVRLATAYLQKYPGHKALVLLTDGEDHRSSPLEAVQAAAETGVHVYILGMGTPEGEPIPVKEGGRVTGYKKDAKGETIVSRLDETGLIKLAAASAGAYYRATDSEEEIQALL
ncbi:MAG: VWA domain-containing protein, partial [Elusimicrobiota bacterium]